MRIQSPLAKGFVCPDCKRAFTTKAFWEDDGFTAFCRFCEGVAKEYRPNNKNLRCKRCKTSIGHNNSSGLCRTCWLCLWGYKRRGKLPPKTSQKPENSKKVIAKSNLELFEYQEMKGGAT